MVTFIITLKTLIQVFTSYPLSGKGLGRIVEIEFSETLCYASLEGLLRKYTQAQYQIQIKNF